MKKIILFAIVIASLICTMPMLVSAAPSEITVTAQSIEGKTEAEAQTIAKANGNDLFDKIVNTAKDGDTIYLTEGKYLLDNNTSRIGAKNITIKGAGIGKTIIECPKYGFVLQYDGLTDRKEMTIQDLTITSGFHSIYAKNNVTVNLENLELNTNSDAAILLDSSNKIGGISHNDVTTIANAKNVTIQQGKKILLNAAPASTVDTSVNFVTYAKFNFTDCTNINEDICEPQYCSIGFGNTFVNNKPLPKITSPEDTAKDIGESVELKVSINTQLEKTYQWQIDKLDGNGFVDIEGATSDTYTTAPLTAEQNGYKYRCAITGKTTVYSDEAVITVNLPIQDPDGNEGEEDNNKQEEPIIPEEPKDPETPKNTSKDETKTPNPPTADGSNSMLYAWTIMTILSLAGVAIVMPMAGKFNK